MKDINSYQNIYGHRAIQPLILNPLPGFLHISGILVQRVDKQAVRATEVWHQQDDLAASEGLLAQRLVRTICQACTAPSEISLEERMALGIAEGEDLQVWRGAGCAECRGTGYRGRTGIYELLVMDDELRSALGHDTSTVELNHLARRKGMELLHEDGLRQMREGVTTAEEVLRVARA